MTKKLLLLALFGLLLTLKSIDAQVIRLKSGIHDLSTQPTANLSPLNTQSVFNNHFYGLSTTRDDNKIPTEHVTAWLNSEVALVHIPLNQVNIESKIYELPSFLKIDPVVMDSLKPNSEIKLRINLFRYDAQIQEQLNKFGITDVYNGLNKSVHISLNSDSIKSLMQSAFIFWAEFPAPQLETHNLRERTNHRVPLIQNLTGPFQLTGKGVIMGEWDGGGADDHIDYEFRLNRIDPFVNNGNGRHATHVAGTMLGAGIQNPEAKGMAPEATFYSYDFFGSVTSEMDSAARKYGIEFTQNSYGYNSSWDNCTRRGTYDNTSVGLDRLTNKYPNLLHVFSAGNSRGSNCLPGGYGTVGSGYQSSKNSLAVGAVRFTDANSWFSSYGPVRDGRLKPEITAVGVDVYSTFPNNTYRGGYNGTSMSCPGTSGTAALITQLFKNRFDTLPDAHLIKGVLCNAADDLGRTGPDYQYGFGRLNGFVAANIINDSNFRMDTVKQNGMFSDTIYINDPHLFKVMLCYTDIEAVASASKTLINDLDLFLTDDAGDTIRPWILDHTNPTTVAFRGIDTLNNIEQVTVETPTSSYFVYHVRGTTVTSNEQIFSVNWLEQDSSLTIVYPNGGEKWVPPTNTTTRQTIRWDAHGISGTGTLSYSIDSGSSWTNISTSVNLDLGYFNWQNCPSTVITARALIKIQQGSFVDSSDAVFNIFQAGPAANAVPCSKQLHITWNGINNAKGYYVYMNDSGAMKNMGYTTEEFFTIKGLADTATYWIAIAPVASDGAEGPRGIARQFSPNPSILTPEFISSPIDSSICGGSAVSFSAITTGTGSIIKEWQLSTDLGTTWQTIPLSNLDTIKLNQAYFSDDSSLYRTTAINACQSLEVSDWGMLLVDSLLPFSYKDTLINTCIEQDSIFELLQNVNNRNKADWYYLAPSSSTPTLLDNDTSITWKIENIQIANRGEYYAVLKNSCGAQSNAMTIELQVNDPLQLSFTGEDTICFGQTATNLAVASGGRATDYDFFWELDTLESIVNQTLTRAHDSTETWRAGVFDFCSADTIYSNKTIVVRTLPEVTISQDTTICLGTSINLIAMATGGNSSSYHYLWSNNLPDSSVVVVSPSTTTTYTLILTDSCSTPRDTATVTVNVLEALAAKITSSKDTLCTNELHTITVSGTGGDTADYRFIWEDGSTSSSRIISTHKDSIFHVQLADNCSVDAGRDSIKITVRAPLQLSISGLDTLCTNELLTLIANPVGGNANNYNYLWDNGSTNSSRVISSENDTFFSLELTDNCTPKAAKDSITIAVRPPLQVTITGTDTLCTNELQNLSATAAGGDQSNYNFLWDDGSNLSTRSIFTDSDTVFTVRLTDNCTVAPANDSFKIVVRPPLDISISGPDTLCLGEEATYTSIAMGGQSSSYQYNWLNANTSSIKILGNKDTVISLELSDGCTPIIAKTQKQIKVREALKLEPTSDLRTCKGSQEMITLKGNGGNTNHYQYFVNNQAIPSNSYTQTYSDSTKLYFRLADNCSADDAFDSMWIDIRPIFPVIFDVKQENLLVKAKTTNDGNENWWGTSANNLNQFGDSTVAINYPNYGPKQLCLQKVDDAGCKETICKDLTLFDVFGTKNIQVTIYPNPADKEINVGLDKVAGKVKINLISADAKYIWRNEYSTFNQTLFTFDVTKLAPAIYFIEVVVNGETIREKIVVQ